MSVLAKLAFLTNLICLHILLKPFLLNVSGICTVNGKILTSIDVKKDLRVQVHSSLKVAMQIDRVAIKA